MHRLPKCLWVCRCVLAGVHASVRMRSRWCVFVCVCVSVCLCVSACLCLCGRSCVHACTHASVCACFVCEALMRSCVWGGGLEFSGISTLSGKPRSFLAKLLHFASPFRVRCIRFWNTVNNMPLSCIDTGSQATALTCVNTGREFSGY